MTIRLQHQINYLIDKLESCAEPSKSKFQNKDKQRAVTTELQYKIDG